REVLVRAAARRWRIEPADCRTENGTVINGRGQRLSYGELAAAAAQPPPPAAPPRKGPHPLRPRRQTLQLPDLPPKCNGSAIYGIDVAVPGMLNAAIKTAPSFTGRVVAIKNEADILKMTGVHAVVRLPAMAVANEDADPLPSLPRLREREGRGSG